MNIRTLILALTAGFLGIGCASQAHPTTAELDEIFRENWRVNCERLGRRCPSHPKYDGFWEQSDPEETIEVEVITTTFPRRNHSGKVKLRFTRE